MAGLFLRAPTCDRSTHPWNLDLVSSFSLSLSISFSKPAQPTPSAMNLTVRFLIGLLLVLIGLSTSGCSRIIFSTFTKRNGYRGHYAPHTTHATHTAHLTSPHIYMTFNQSFRFFTLASSIFPRDIFLLNCFSFPRLAITTFSSFYPNRPIFSFTTYSYVVP